MEHNVVRTSTKQQLITAGVVQQNQLVQNSTTAGIVQLFSTTQQLVQYNGVINTTAGVVQGGRGRSKCRCVPVTSE